MDSRTEVIPFDFSVAGRILSAGIQNIYTVNLQMGIRITNIDGKHTAIANTRLSYTGPSSPDSRLVFRQFCSESFLTQIWSAVADLSRNPAPGKRTTELASGDALARASTVMALDKGR